jgi:hypothetical protein
MTQNQDDMVAKNIKAGKPEVVVEEMPEAMIKALLQTEEDVENKFIEVCK